MESGRIPRGALRLWLWAAGATNTTADFSTPVFSMLSSRFFVQRLNHSFVILFAVLLLAPTAIAADFAWKFRQGEKILVAIDTKTQIDSQTAGAEAQSSTIHQIVSLEWTVLAVSPEQVADIEQKVTRVRMDSDDSLGKLQYDSQSPSANNRAQHPALTSVTNLLNTSLRLKIKPTGEVIASEQNNTSDARSNGVSLSPTSSPLEKSLFSGIRFPSANVEVGEPWTESFPIELPSIGAIKVSTTYQYLGEEQLESKTLDKIKTSTAFRLANKGASVRLKKQDAMGTIWFDRNVGKIVQLDNAQELSVIVIADGKETEQSLLQSVEIQFQSL